MKQKTALSFVTFYTTLDMRLNGHLTTCNDGENSDAYKTSLYIQMDAMLYLLGCELASVGESSDACDLYLTGLLSRTPHRLT
jgi:hypothetical protein